MSYLQPLSGMLIFIFFAFLLSNILLLSENKRIKQIAQIVNYLAFICLTHLLIQQFYSRELGEVPQESLTQLEYSNEAVLNFKSGDLDVKATKDAIFFSYQNLLSGKKVKPLKSRFFKGEGLRFQLLRDNKVVEFTKIYRIDNGIVCEFDQGSLTTVLEQSKFCANHKFKLKLNEMNPANYRIIATAKMLNDLDILKTDSETPVKMEAAEKYTDSVWASMQSESTILYICGFKDAMVDGRFIFSNQTYQASEDLTSTKDSILSIHRVPFIVQNIENDFYGIEKGSKILNLWQGMSKIKIWILKAVERIMSIFNIPFLVLILTSLVYKLLTTFDVLLIGKRRISGQVIPFINLIKLFLGLQLISIVANSGIFHEVTVLWLDDPLSLGDDQFFAAIYTVSKNFTSAITGIFGKVGIIISTAILIPISLLMMRYTLIFFLDENKRFFASLHYKMLILTLTTVLLSIVYRGCVIILGFPEIPDRLYGILLHVPIYFSLSIYSYFIILNNKNSSQRADVQLVVDIAAPLLYFLFFNLLIPFLPLPFYKSPLIVLGLSLNQLFDKFFDDLINKYTAR